MILIIIFVLFHLIKERIQIFEQNDFPVAFYKFPFEMKECTVIINQTQINVHSSANYECKQNNEILYGHYGMSHSTHCDTNFFVSHCQSGSRPKFIACTHHKTYFDMAIYYCEKINLICPTNEYYMSNFCYKWDVRRKNNFCQKMRLTKFSVCPP